MRYIPASIALLATLAACGEAPRPASADTAPAATIAPATHVDSILPVAEELRRFQAAVPAPAGLAGGASSQEALVRRFVDRLAARDTAALLAMTLDRAEFAHLVYPASSYTRPPYRTPPGLVWMQLVEDSRKGLTRLLRAERDVREYLGHECSPTPVRDGASRLWRGCTTRVLLASGDTLAGRLFGVIVEQGGQFKFASLDTDF